MHPFDLRSVEVLLSNLEFKSIQSECKVVSLSNLNVLYTNATSLMNKVEEFKILCALKNPHIIAVTETWFTTSSIANLAGYTLYKRNRNDGRKGVGVAIYVDNKIISYEISEEILSCSKIESIWITIISNKIKYLIGCINRPNEQTDMIEMNQIFQTANNIVQINNYSDLLILGDFNFPSIKWSNGFVDDILSGEESTENQFVDIVNEIFLYQHVCIPTFQQTDFISNNILDLVFSKSSERVHELESNAILGNISHGHLVLTFKLALDDSIEEESPKYKFDYTRSDFHKITENMDKIDWNFMLNNLSVQEMYDVFVEILSKACNTFVPKININLKKKRKNPWFTEEVGNLVRKKQNLRYMNLACKFKNPANITEYKQVCKLVTKQAIKARVDFENNLVEKAKINPKLLYKYVNSQKKVKQSIKALRNGNGIVTNDPTEITELLNK